MAATTATAVDYSILDAFDGPITPPRTSFLYQCSLLFVAVTMLLLPLIYLAFVFFASWLVYYHAVYDFGPIMQFGGSAGGGRAMILKFLCYAAPLFIGLVVVFFLFKPLLARQPKAAQPLAVNPATDPLLYAFVERICACVGAPSPKRIDLDCQLNAAASFRRGFLSFFGHDLVLILGLPLVANLSAGELAGVIAHEFGHFTQGLGMRLSYFIRRVNSWFARVVYQRDAWDVWLESWANSEEDSRIRLVLWIARLGVALSRGLLWLLMMTGHVICGFLLRQMEYDADMYAIRVVGSATVETTQRRLASLHVAFQQTERQMADNWKKFRTLPDNLPEVLRRNHAALRPEICRQIDDAVGLHRAGLLASHPSFADRIRQARRIDDPGLFHDERPASLLFASFAHPAHFVTLLHYTDNLGLQVTQQMLSPVVAERPDVAAENPVPKPSSPAGVAQDFFGGVLPLLLPLRLPAIAASENLETDLVELGRLASVLLEVNSQLAEARDQFMSAADREIKSRIAQCLLRNGLAADPAQFGGSEQSLQAATDAENQSLNAQKARQDSLNEVAPALLRRFELALSIALAMRGTLSEAESLSLRINELAAALNLEAEQFNQQVALNKALAVLVGLDSIRAVRGGNEAMSRTFNQQAQIVQSLAGELAPNTEPSESAGGLKLRKTAGSEVITGNRNLIAINEENIRWMRAYHERIHELVSLAASVETLNH